MASFINLTDLIYPIGAYYLSGASTSPASLFGGSWYTVTGRFLYCNSGTVTGGANTHTLTTAQMPSHSHKMEISGCSSEAQGFGLSPSASFRDRIIVKAQSGMQSGWDSSSTGGGHLTTICQHIRRAIVGEEPLNLCRGEA